MGTSHPAETTHFPPNAAEVQPRIPLPGLRVSRKNEPGSPTAEPVATAVNHQRSRAAYERSRAASTSAVTTSLNWSAVGAPLVSRDAWAAMTLWKNVRTVRPLAKSL